MTAPATTVPGALEHLVRAGGARPLVTFYDDAAGERVELSVASFANWVAKTANLMQDELDVAAGAVVRVDLPAHWQTCVWLCAAWSAGCVVDFGTEAVETDLTVTGPPVPRRPPNGMVVATSLHPLGAAFDQPMPAGTVDYGAHVLAQPDDFVAVEPPGPDSPALLDPDGGASHADLLDRAREVACATGLHPAGRVLSDANPASAAGLYVCLLAPVVVGGSVVLVRHLDPARLAERVSAEHVTVRAVGSVEEPPSSR